MSQEKILEKLHHFFRETEKEDLKYAPDFMITFLELTDTIMYDFDLFTRVLAISTNDEYLQLLREHDNIAYYEFSSQDFPSKWFYQSAYWRHTIIEKIVISFKTEYKVFIPNQFHPLVLSKDGIYVVVAPIGQFVIRGETFTFRFDQAIPDVRTGMERYDAQVQKDIQAGYKWKLEFEKNNMKGLRKLFGYYTNRKLCFKMADIINEDGNFVFISKVLVIDDKQYKESKLLG